MAGFLSVSATNCFLEELIEATRERLVVISPVLTFNDRIRELLDRKDRMKLTALGFLRQHNLRAY